MSRSDRANSRHQPQLGQRCAWIIVFAETGHAGAQVRIADAEDPGVISAHELVPPPIRARRR